MKIQHVTRLCLAAGFSLMAAFLTAFAAAGQTAGTPEPVRGDGAVLVYAPGGTMSAQNPAFSPDGGSIAFTLFQNGYNQGPASIGRIPPSGGQTQSIWSEAGRDCVNTNGSVWNANQLVAFSADRGISGEKICTVGAYNQSVNQITKDNPPGKHREASFSPDGNWLVFQTVLSESGDRFVSNIWKVKTDGTGLLALTSGQSDDRQPNWSPRGDLISFQRRVPGTDNWMLFVMSPDGTGLRQVTGGQYGDTDASWSPDGRWLVYSSDFGDLTLPQIFIISLDGGLPRRITFNSANEDGAPSWSPDGKWIVFESHSSASAPSILRRIVPPTAISSRPIGNTCMAHLRRQGDRDE